jgi:hypothetical protein
MGINMEFTYYEGQTLPIIIGGTLSIFAAIDPFAINDHFLQSEAEGFIEAASVLVARPDHEL